MNAGRFPDTAEIDRLAKTLERLTAQAQAIQERDAECDPAADDLVDLARRLYRMRRVRDRELVTAQLPLGEPTWDMLLDLFVADSAGRDLSVSSLAIASQAAPTTGLRYIEALVASGLVSKVSHTADRRSRMLRLTDEGRARMRGCLAAMTKV